MPPGRDCLAEYAGLAVYLAIVLLMTYMSAKTVSSAMSALLVTRPQRHQGCSGREERAPKAVAGGLAPVSIPRAFAGGPGRVAGEHRPRLPAGEAHQVPLGAAIGQPIVRERVS